MPEDQPPQPSNATPDTNQQPVSPPRSSKNEPAATTPPASSGGIHFRVRTLKSDLEASAGQEHSADLHRVTPPAETITLPPVLAFDFTPPPPTQPKPATPPAASLKDLTMPRVIYPPNEVRPASPPADSTTPPRPVPPPTPVGLAGPRPVKPEIFEIPGPISSAEAEPFAVALDRAIANATPPTNSIDSSQTNLRQTPPSTLPAIKFEEPDYKPFSLIRNFHFIYLTPLIAIFLVLGGFGLWRIRTAPPPPEETAAAPAQTPEQPLFTPPTGEPTEPLSVPAATSEELISPSQTSTGTAATEVTTRPAETTTTTLKTIAVRSTPLTPDQQEQTAPLIKTTEEPKSPQPNQPVVGTQREPQPRLSGEKLKALSTSTSNSPVTPLLLDLPTVEVMVSELTTASFQRAWGQAIAPQRPAGTLTIVRFTLGGQRLPLDLIFHSLFDPRFIESRFTQNFIEALGPSYELILYYTHTRKFPLLVADVGDELTVVPFLKLWDKESFIDDSAGLYRDLSRGKFIRKFLVTKTLPGSGGSGKIDYRIAYRDDDYKLIWLVYNGRVIMSTTLSGTQILLNQFKISE